MIRLTEEEIVAALQKVTHGELTITYDRAVAQAQLQKVVEWIEGGCLEHEHKYKTIRRYCFECRREMRVEAGLSYHPAGEAEEG